MEDLPLGRIAALVPEFAVNTDGQNTDDGDDDDDDDDDQSRVLLVFFSFSS